MEGKPMSTTVTIVDPFKGTLVIETSKDVEIFLGSHTSVKVGGEEQGPTTTGPSEPAIIRTPDPKDQTMTVTDLKGDTPKGIVQQAADRMAAAESARRDREVLGSRPHGAYALDHEATLVFIQEFKTRIQAKCQTCGQVVYIEKLQYHPDELDRIKARMVNYPTESPQDAPETKEPEQVAPEGPALVLNGPAKRKLATKRCNWCGDEYQGANRSMYCDQHKDPATRTRTPAAQPERQLTPNDPLPEGYWWCIHHQSQQPHRSPECPLLEPKTPAQLAAEAAEAAGEGDEFTDPWNCARCREEKHLCRFHRSMEGSGKKPPVNVKSIL